MMLMLPSKHQRRRLRRLLGLFALSLMLSPQGCRKDAAGSVAPANHPSAVKAGLGSMRLGDIPSAVTAVNMEIFLLYTTCPSSPIPATGITLSTASGGSSGTGSLTTGSSVAATGTLSAAQVLSTLNPACIAANLSTSLKSGLSVTLNNIPDGNYSLLVLWESADGLVVEQGADPSVTIAANQTAVANIVMGASLSTSGGTDATGSLTVNFIQAPLVGPPPPTVVIAFDATHSFTFPFAAFSDAQRKQATASTAPTSATAAPTSGGSTAATSSTAVSIAPLMTPVRNQGNRGTCATFASVALVERYAGGDLSEQCVVGAFGGNDGAFVLDRLNHISADGLLPSSACPYDANNPAANLPAGLFLNDPTDSYPTLAIDLEGSSPPGKGLLIGNDTGNDLLATIRANIQLGNPVAISFVVVDSAFNFATGQVAVPSTLSCIGTPIASANNCPGHAVTVTGYDDSKGLIEFKNSWGTDFGASGPRPGYGYMTYDYFTRFNIDGGQYLIPPTMPVHAVNAAYNRCLDSQAATDSQNGGVMQLWDCGAWSNQEWLFHSDGTIRNSFSGKCLDADTNTIASNGTNVQVWQCLGTANQSWTRVNDTFVNKASGRCLDADARGGGVNGNRIQLWDCVGSLNQNWILQTLP